MGGAVAEFYQQLSELAQAHCPLPDCLIRAAAASRSRRFRGVLADVQARVNGGGSLSRAMGEHPDWFDTQHVRLVEAAERSDALPEVLEAIAREARFEKLYVDKAREAIAYPAFIFHLGAVLLLTVSTLFMPVYGETLAYALEVGRDLGRACEFCIDFSNGVAARWPWLASMEALLLVATLWLVLGGRLAHRLGLKLLGRTPGTHDIVRAIDSARICGVWRMFLERKLPIIDALRASAAVVHDGRLQQTLLRVAEGNARGEALTGLLEGESILDRLIVFSIRSRPEGDLPQALSELQGHFEQEVISAIRNAAVLWGVVGLIVMSAVALGMALMVFIPVMSLPGAM